MHGINSVIMCICWCI